MKRLLFTIFGFLLLTQLTFGAVATTTVRKPTVIQELPGYPAGTGWDIKFTNPGSAGEATDTTIWGPVWNLDDFKVRPSALSILCKARADEYTTKDDVADSLLIEGRYTPPPSGGWVQGQDSLRILDMPNFQDKWIPRGYLTTGPEANTRWFRLAPPIYWNANDSIYQCTGTVFIPPFITELRLRSIPQSGGDSLRDVNFRMMFFK